MKIGGNAVVLIDYKLTDEAGEVLDTSEGGDPLAYLHGNGNLIPGLEKALEGKEAGHSIAVSIPPADGYGTREEKLVIRVSRDKFEPEVAINVGMQFRGQTPQGDRIMTVVEVGDETVTVDGNHPLADKTLNFAVRVIEVREATAEELAHGHVHGPGGHHH